MGQGTTIVVGEMRQLTTLEDDLFTFVILLALNQPDSFSITYESILFISRCDTSGDYTCDVISLSLLSFHER